MPSTPALAILTETVNSSLGVGVSLGSSPGPITYSAMFSLTSLKSFLKLRVSISQYQGVA